MVDVKTEIVIQQPIHVVSDFAANPENAPTWYVNIKTVEWKSEPPLQKGSLVAFLAHFMGEAFRYTYEFTVFEPENKLVMKTAEGPFSMETTYTCYALPDQSTRMTLRNAGQPSGFSKLFAPFMSLIMRKANMKDLENLKRILESEA